MSDKIRKEHLAKKAYCYLRQSTHRQVIKNTGSTEMQYALKDKAMELGWPISHIKVLDQDLGLTGTEIDNRQSFNELISDLSQGKVGAVFVLEVSRLDRANVFFHHFLKICQHTNTLILDRDGVYDPNNSADQLMLGIKSAVAQAELKVLQARMHGAKLHKASKGVLKFRLPSGYCHDGLGKLIIDPDEEIRSAVRMLFDVYKGTSSAADVVKYFLQHGLTFPTRATHGSLAGQTVWKQLSKARVTEILKNPTYAGTYAYGRNKTVSKFNANGNFYYSQKTVPMSEWKVSIQGNHEGYITWEDYMQNCRKLSDNSSKSKNAPTTIREGSGLLQGILVCKICGRFMRPRYIGDGGKKAQYYCFNLEQDDSTRHCTNLGAQFIDEAISKRILSVMQQDEIEIALAAVEECDKTRQDIDRQWSLKIERAQYDSSLAEIRYKKVDPNNRLVANNLEREWNDTLLMLERLKQECEEFKQKAIRQVTQEEKDRLMELSKNVLELWKATTTSNKERKQLIRMLVKDIMVEKKENELHVCVRWQGGKLEEFQIPQTRKKQTYSSNGILKRIKELASEYSDKEIATLLNNEGTKTVRGGQFTRQTIYELRQRPEIEVVK